MKAIGRFKHAGVANHPGDRGMVAIACAILEAFFPKRPRVARTIRPAGTCFSFAPESQTYRPLNDDYRVFVDGLEAEVRACRESRFPFNRPWPGRQRPLDQSERASYLAIEASGPVAFRVVPKCAVRKAVVRPLSRGVAPQIKVMSCAETDGAERPFENISFENFSLNGRPWHPAGACGSTPTKMGVCTWQL